MVHKPRISHWLYFGGLLLWTLSVLVNPPWIGTLYNPDEYRQPATWGHAGEFGLAGADGFEKRAPLWSPPAAHSPRIKATVRWPWQPPSADAHVELFVAEIAKLFSYGLISLGSFAGLMSFVGLATRGDRITNFAWSLALCQIIAWMVIFVLFVASMGYATTGTMTTSLLAVGVACGLIYGWVSSSRQAAGRDKSPNEKRVGDPSSDGRMPKKTRSWKPGRMSLLMFVIGLVTSCVIAWTAIGVVVAIAPWLQGGVDVDGFASVSGWMRVLTGAGIVALGWILGVMLWWARWIRSFSLGLIIGGTALGLLCLVWH
jgi:hypothetical protein